MSETIFDEQFGQLIWGAQFGWWKGKLKLSDKRSIALCIETPDSAATEITPAVRAACRVVIASERQMRQRAARRCSICITKAGMTMRR